MSTTIKVLTLNCWGVFTPLACQLRSERMDAIGKELSKGEHDIVLLQEIWTQSDYDKLCTRIIPAMPYTHYWHSGMFGTGCCIFSKHPIIDTFLFRFGLNGYAHRPQHGDWFGGKGVGLATVFMNDITINVYCTHTHAQYNEERDEYEAHRVVQGYEMGQFIKLTSSGCDAVIVGGDFNFQPKDLGFKLIKCNGNLMDAWIDQSDKEMCCHAGTFAHPTNGFCSTRSKQQYPAGKCIDFVLFRCNSGYMMNCEKCYLTMGKVPDETYHYSDHEGVAAIFKVNKNVTARPPVRNLASLEQHLTEALPIINHGYKQVRATQVFYFVVTAMCMLAVFVGARLSLPYCVGYGISAILALISVFGLWSALVLCNRELNGLISAQKDIKNLLKAGNGVVEGKK